MIKEVIMSSSLIERRFSDFENYLRENLVEKTKASALYKNISRSEEDAFMKFYLKILLEKLSLYKKEAEPVVPESDREQPKYGFRTSPAIPAGGVSAIKIGKVPVLDLVEMIDSTLEDAIKNYLESTAISSNIVKALKTLDDVNTVSLEDLMAVQNELGQVYDRKQKITPTYRIESYLSEANARFINDKIKSNNKEYHENVTKKLLDIAKTAYCKLSVRNGIQPVGSGADIPPNYLLNFQSGEAIEFLVEEDTERLEKEEKDSQVLDLKKEFSDFTIERYQKILDQYAITKDYIDYTDAALSVGAKIKDSYSRLVSLIPDSTDKYLINSSIPLSAYFQRAINEINEENDAINGSTAYKDQYENVRSTCAYLNTITGTEKSDFLEQFKENFSLIVESSSTPYTDSKKIHKETRLEIADAIINLYYDLVSLDWSSGDHGSFMNYAKSGLNKILDLNTNLENEIAPYLDYIRDGKTVEETIKVGTDFIKEACTYLLTIDTDDQDYFLNEYEKKFTYSVEITRTARISTKISSETLKTISDSIKDILVFLNNSLGLEDALTTPVGNNLQDFQDKINGVINAAEGIKKLDNTLCNFIQKACLTIFNKINVDSYFADAMDSVCSALHFSYDGNKLYYESEDSDPEYLKNVYTNSPVNFILYDISIDTDGFTNEYITAFFYNARDWNCSKYLYTEEVSTVKFKDDSILATYNKTAEELNTSISETMKTTISEQCGEIRTNAALLKGNYTFPDDIDNAVITSENETQITNNFSLIDNVINDYIDKAKEYTAVYNYSTDYFMSLLKTNQYMDKFVVDDSKFSEASTFICIYPPKSTEGN